MNDPTLAIGALMRGDSFLGTFFCWRRFFYAVTAAHNLQDDSPTDELRLYRPGAEESRAVERVETHPEADVAVLIGEQLPNDDLSGPYDRTTFNMIRSATIPDELYSYGYPVETTLSRRAEAVPRLFTVHPQRVFDYVDERAGYSYEAVELSVPAPRGLSGSPVFYVRLPFSVAGIVVANFESHLIRHFQETEETAGERYRLEQNLIVTYGVAVTMQSVSAWLDAVAPASQSLEPG